MLAFGNVRAAFSMALFFGFVWFWRGFLLGMHGGTKKDQHIKSKCTVEKNCRLEVGVFTFDSLSKLAGKSVLFGLGMNYVRL